jgi:hypothetical protein
VTSIPGRPRLVLPAGGEVRNGSPGSLGDQPTWFLQLGPQTLGDPPRAEVVVSEDGVVLLRALHDPVEVDGRPVLEQVLAAGNRIEARGATMVFESDPVGDDTGRQGGELG